MIRIQISTYNRASSLASRPHRPCNRSLRIRRTSSSPTRADSAPGGRSDCADGPSRWVEPHTTRPEPTTASHLRKKTRV